MVGLDVAAAHCLAACGLEVASGEHYATGVVFNPFEAADPDILNQSASKTCILVTTLALGTCPYHSNVATSKPRMWLAAPGHYGQFSQ